MQKKSSLYSHLLAIGSLAGTIIGLGMFGIPYVAVRAGIGLTMVYLLVFGAVMLVVHLMYLEVTLRTRDTHRFVGYVGIYFGKKWKFISSVMSVLALWGSLLIYTIVGGEFLNVVAGRFNYDGLFWMSLAFFVVGSFAVARPPRTIGKVEAFFVAGIVAIVFLFFFRGIFKEQIDYSNFNNIVDWKNWLVPYGVILFAFGGFSIIPSLENILAREIKAKEKLHFGHIGIWGVVIPFIVYIFFILAVVGISGAETSQEALSGLEATLGNGYVFWGSIIGFFALFTSFLALGNELKRIFKDDYGLPRNFSLFLTLSVPLILFLLNIATFIQAMTIIGAFLGAYVYSMSILLFYKTKKDGEMAPLFSFNFPELIAGIFIFVFIIGGIYSIISVL